MFAGIRSVVTSLQGNHTTLGAQSSSSFVQSTQQFKVTYGSGAMQGLLCQDNVNIAGLALTNHTFGVATAESIQFASGNTPFDGLMGLAQSVSSSRCVCISKAHTSTRTDVVTRESSYSGRIAGSKQAHPVSDHLLQDPASC